MNEQLPGWIVAMQSFGLESMLQVLVAGLLGGLIGLEREWRGRDAGLRTNMLIAMGACLFTAISINGFPLQGSTAQDTARVAAQVVTGVGFLGAGAFIHTRSHTKGMTTAATIWMVAAIGMTVNTVTVPGKGRIIMTTVDRGSTSGMIFRDMTGDTVGCCIGKNRCLYCCKQRCVRITSLVAVSCVVMTGITSCTMLIQYTGPGRKTTYWCMTLSTGICW